MTERTGTPPKKAPRLSPSQLESPDTLPAEELTRRRAQSSVEERNRQHGIELLRQGARLLAQGRAGEAAAKLEQATVLLPHDTDVAINLGGAYVLQGRYNKAVGVLEQASQQEPDNVMIWTNLAAAYLGSLQYSGPQRQGQAIAAYERALEIDSTTPNVHYNLGLIYKDRQDWARARDYFLEALAVNPGDRDAHTWLAWLAQAETALAGASPEQAPDSPSSEDMA